MSKRINTVQWTDCEVMTRLMSELQIEIVKWQKYTYPPENLGDRGIIGDFGVIVSAINLNKKLNEIIERNPN